VIVGACLDNIKRDSEIRDKCKQLENVEAPGWLIGEERDAVLDNAWVLINTSTKECLPVSYIEAGAHKCAILSHGNADDFASSFGFWAEIGNLDDYERGLTFLLNENRWMERGERAYNYVRYTHEYNRVIDQHIEAYNRVIENGL
jgi:glycosyltransferase involved in cell wall biosynthesis